MNTLSVEAFSLLEGKESIGNPFIVYNKCLLHYLSIIKHYVKLNSARTRSFTIDEFCLIKNNKIWHRERSIITLPIWSNGNLCMCSCLCMRPPAKSPFKVFSETL